MKRRICVVDERIDALAERKLNLLGFSVFTVPKSKYLPAPLSSHRDMLIAKVGRELVSTCDYCDEAAFLFSDLSCALRGYKLSFSADKLCDKYPLDCILNVLVMGKKMFCKVDTVSSYLLKSAKKQGYDIVNVKQGYPCCTVLPLDDSHAVTADIGMKKVLENNGIDVTLIENGDITLSPYEYGFIGGCGGVCDGTVYFSGDVTRHRSYEKIKGVCDRLNLKIVSLCDGPLVDLGGLLFLEYDCENQGADRD